MIKENKTMGKRTKKVSINITEEEYQLLEKLASHERRSVSELASLILMDNALLLYGEMQPKGKMSKVVFYCPTLEQESNDPFSNERLN